MSGILFEHIFDIDIGIGGFHRVGAGPWGRRGIAEVTGGSVTGPDIRGTILPGTGGDWATVGPDGNLLLDVRLTFETDDNALVYMRYHGFMTGPKDVLRAMNKGEAVDPSAYYFRTAPIFETGPGRHDWLNRIVAVGIGESRPQGPLYHVYKVL